MSFLSVGATPSCPDHNSPLITGGWMQFDSSFYALSISQIFGSLYSPSAVAGELMAIVT